MGGSSLDLSRAPGVPSFIDLSYGAYSSNISDSASSLFKESLVFFKMLSLFPIFADRSVLLSAEIYDFTSRSVSFSLIDPKIDLLASIGSNPESI